jgi:N-acetylmuramoyl-L-alanine amidase
MTAWKGTIAKGFTPEEFQTYVDGLDFSAWTPEFVVLHNTDIPRFADWHNEPGEQRMRGLADFYENTQHWSGGPHLFIADDLIWAFTPLTVPGVHAPSWNAISWGVEMVGNYSIEPLTDEVKANTVAALKTLHNAIGIDPITLHLHKEDPETDHKDCPGTNVDKTEIVRLVAAP